MRAEMDRLWEAMMSGRWPRLTTLSSLPQIPPIDVYEKDGQVHVRADLPGLKENEVDIEVDADGIVISGEKRDEREVKEESFYRSERSYGKFTRRVALPAGADTENATASFKNGVLEIDMPLKQEQGKKKIEIKS
jgi:HSP20 family protein